MAAPEPSAIFGDYIDPSFVDYSSVPTADVPIADAPTVGDLELDLQGELDQLRLNGVPVDQLELPSWQPMYFVALFVLPFLPRILLMLPRVTNQPWLRNGLLLLGIATSAATLLGFVWFVLETVFLFRRVPNQHVLLPAEQYVSVLENGSAGDRARSVDIALAFFFDLEHDRNSANVLFRASVADGALEVGLTVMILGYAAVHQLLNRPKQSPQGERQRSPFNCFKLISKPVKLVSQALFVSSILCLLLGFLLGPLIRASVHEPGFDHVRPEGLRGQSYNQSVDPLSFQRKLLLAPEPDPLVQFRAGPAAFCPRITNLTEYYIAHMFWPDVTNDILNETSASYRVFGTQNITIAAEMVRDLDCVVADAIETGQVPVDGSVVYPVSDVVSCSCRLGSMTCPSVGQVFELLQDAGGPRPENGSFFQQIIGIKCFWTFSLVFAYFLTFAMLIVLISEMLGWTLDVFSEKDNDGYVFSFIVVLVCVYLTVCLAAMALTIARWTGVNVHYEQREVIVGNMCVTKAGNLYAKDMSLNIALLLISDIFAVAHLLIGFWYQLEEGFKQTFGGAMQLPG